MIKLRLQGTLEEIEWFKEKINQDKNIRVLEVSELYKNRGISEYYRVYIDAERE